MNIEKKAFYKELLELGKSKGSLSNQEIMDILDEVALDPEQIEKLYETLEELNIDVIDEEDEKEIEASKHDLAYIALEGNIGCMVNGAGLAMATMDTINHFGGKPANFLDVGGGATAEKVTEAFKIILSDKNVKGIFVNIFGGIMKCDVIAEGVVEAAKQVSLDVPLVVRLEGTNVDLGKKILEESGINITAAESMADGAQKIVSLIG